MHILRAHVAAFRVPAVLLLCLAPLLSATAQQPDTPPPPPDLPPPVIFANTIPAAQLSFVHGYAGQSVKHLRKDRQFRALMKLAVPRTEYHYGRDMPLSDAIEIVLAESVQLVSVVDGRYAFVPGGSGPYLHGRGFMWFDMQQGDVLGAFYFQPTNGEPTPTLTVFSRQLSGTYQGISQLPDNFTEALRQWSMAEQIPVVSPTYFIPENGRKYVLVHDKDYCAQTPGAPATTTGVCEQLNANAADADMNAAYFMQETHNAADATAWMLGPEQVAWISLREHRCGPGLPCRIATARSRTRVLLGLPTPVPRTPPPVGPRRP